MRFFGLSDSFGRHSTKVVFISFSKSINTDFGVYIVGWWNDCGEPENYDDDEPNDVSDDDQPGDVSANDDDGDDEPDDVLDDGDDW